MLISDSQYILTLRIFNYLSKELFYTLIFRYKFLKAIYYFCAYVYKGKCKWNILVNIFLKVVYITINYKAYSNFNEVEIQNVCPRFKETNCTLRGEGTRGWCCRLGRHQCVKGTWRSPREKAGEAGETQEDLEKHALFMEPAEVPAGTLERGDFRSRRQPWDCCV